VNLTVLRDHVELCKPRVVALMVLTAWVAMLLASPVNFVAWPLFLFGSLGIAFTACAGGVINHLIDRHVDTMMARTKGRPIAAGRVNPLQAIISALLLGVGGILILATLVNITTAVLSFLSLIGYAGVYTLVLKRATPQNIVIGGLAGAMPPLLGWCAITGQVTGEGLLLVLIIFAWTPPHFWALAIHRHKEYALVNIPMLPVTHGVPFTRLNVLLYTFLMIAITYLPFAIEMSGWFYLIGVTILNVGFLYYVLRLYYEEGTEYALKTFHYSIFYLMVLFIVLLVDHYVSLFI
jgi:protoheme IX farnesyltransferase